MLQKTYIHQPAAPPASGLFYAYYFHEKTRYYLTTLNNHFVTHLISISYNMTKLFLVKPSKNSLNNSQSLRDSDRDETNKKFIINEFNDTSRSCSPPVLPEDPAQKLLTLVILQGRSRWYLCINSDEVLIFRMLDKDAYRI